MRACEKYFQHGRFLSGMFGIAALVAIFSANGAVNSPAQFSGGFGETMLLAAVFSLAGAVAGLCLPARARVAAAPTPQDA